MSPIALSLLSKAYKHYEQTLDVEFSYQPKNADDLFYSTEAACQLYDNGYIKDVSEFVFSDSISNLFEPIVFTITFKGINYMRSNRKL